MRHTEILVKVAFLATLFLTSHQSIGQEDVRPFPEDTLPNTFDYLNVEIANTDGAYVEVYASSANGALDQNKRVYYYAPPSLFVQNKDGSLRHEFRDIAEKGTEYTFYIQILNQSLAPTIAAQWSQLKGEEVAATQIHPLRISFIEVKPDTSKYAWSVKIPDQDADLPALRASFPVRVLFRTRSEANEFHQDLEDGLSLKVRYGYGGYTLTQNIRQLTTSALKKAGFVSQLEGPANSKYVTREQIQDALISSARLTQDIWYLENPETDLSALKWFEQNWKEERVEWNTFVSDYLAELSKYSFSGDDLSPDRLNKFVNALKTEMEDETKDEMEIDTQFKNEVSFFELASVESDNKLKVKKEQFNKTRRLRDSTIEWEGDKITPKSVRLYIINNETIEQEHILASRVISARKTSQSIQKLINSKDRIAPSELFPLTPSSDAPKIRIDEKTSITQLMAKEQWLSRDKRKFSSALEFYNWLHLKPRLTVASEILIDRDHDFIAASEIVMEAGGSFKTVNGNDLRLLTLNFVNRGGTLLSYGLSGQDNSETGDPGSNGASYSFYGRDGCFATNAGGNGGPGATGPVGGRGGDAGSFTVAAFSIAGKFNATSTGGLGGSGGKGGKAGNGGNGQGAAGGSSAAFSCKCGGNPGRRGGDSGLGGKGGTGGTGGRSGDLKIITTTQRTSWGEINLTGGLGGTGGAPGDPGSRGVRGHKHGGDGLCSAQRGGSSDGNVLGNLGTGDTGTTGANGTFDVDVLLSGIGRPNYQGFYLWVNTQP